MQKRFKKDAGPHNILKHLYDGKQLTYKDFYDCGMVPDNLPRLIRLKCVYKTEDGKYAITGTGRVICDKITAGKPIRTRDSCKQRTNGFYVTDEMPYKIVEMLYYAPEKKLHISQIREAFPIKADNVLYRLHNIGDVVFLEDENNNPEVCMLTEHGKTKYNKTHQISITGGTKQMDIYDRILNEVFSNNENHDSGFSTQDIVEYARTSFKENNKITVNNNRLFNNIRIKLKKLCERKIMQKYLDTTDNRYLYRLTDYGLRFYKPMKPHVETKNQPEEVPLFIPECTSCSESVQEDITQKDTTDQSGDKLSDTIKQLEKMGYTPTKIRELCIDALNEELKSYKLVELQKRMDELKAIQAEIDKLKGDING